jgi:DNA-binding CsgD family transcriptional regulator
VEVLRVAAENAVRRGRPEDAARYLRRALLHTSADGGDRARVLVDLATAECGFDIRSAVRSTSYAVGLLGTPRERAAAVIQLTPTVLGDAPPLVRSLLEQVAGELGDLTRLDGVDRELALRIEARLRYSAVFDFAEPNSAMSRLAAMGSEPPMTTGAERELLAVLLHAATAGAHRTAAEVAELAGRLFEYEPALSAHASGTAPLLCIALAAADLPGVVTTWLERAFGAAQRRGDAVDQAMIRVEQAVVHLLSGHLTDATRAAADAVDLGVWSEHTAGTAAAFLVGLVAVQLRNPVLTGRLLDSACRVEESGCLGAVTGFLRGSAALLRGDLATTAVTWAESGRSLDRSGWRNPVLFPWRSSLALVKHRLGETAEALELAEEERLVAEQWGAPSGVGRAWRVLGLLVGGPAGADWTCRAVKVLEGSAHRLELARALRQWAEASGRDDVWRRCLEVATEIDAKPIAERARIALRNKAFSFRGSRLTPSERRVALLAVRGSSNQEIAEALGVAGRTVEKHLTNTYLKLGVRGRAELVEGMLWVPAEHDDGTVLE